MLITLNSVGTPGAGNRHMVQLGQMASISRHHTVSVSNIRSIKVSTDDGMVQF